MASKLIRCAPDNPKRCQNLRGCPFLAAEGVSLCVRHGATAQLAKKEKESVRMYNVAIWKERIKALGEDPNARTLTEETAILRMALEAVLEKCKIPEDLFMYSSKIGDLSIRIEKLITSMHKIETASGQTMDRSASLHFAATVVEIVDNVVRSLIKDEELSDKVTGCIGDRIMQALSKGNEDG